MKGIRVFSAAALALVLVAVLACPAVPAAARAVADRPSLWEQFVQVVAHPDDDLLFMSPDLYGAVQQDRPTVTVYLTAGEGQAGWDDDRDPVAYAHDRAEGLRAAYAFLAGARNVWRTRTITAGGVPVRLEELADRPAIRLAFAGLPDGGDPRADGGRDALTRLWEGRSCVRRFGQAGVPGQRGAPAEGGVSGPERHCVAKGDVVAMLSALYARFRPTVLRTLDPEPPRRRGLCDHPDHVASARFALAAARGLRLRVVSYRGYPMTGWAPNVVGALRELKRRVFGVYLGHDYRVGHTWRYRAWTERMYRVPGP
ncbi:PIG-L family deacetylase [Nonomuraea sp. WAC 01424]|uniref:PIG-L family deacetylase n=1 Tax=Nonomuraea sp. WAC 01424 TaxID=2203200 RepID=UPI000F795EEC|nr:PIG-L family deacetylase [Nonomuraea sp. WAC 01424]